MSRARACNRVSVRAWWSVALAAVAALPLACRQRVEAPPTDVVAVVSPVLPSEPGDPAWGVVPVFHAPLLLQDVVEPRQLAATTTQVAVQAMSDGERLAVRLAWDDATRNDLPGAARFSDACAVQVPQVVEASAPNPQMGEAGRPVDITYWRAAWQAEVDGRGLALQDLYPNAAVDHYPFTAAPLEASPELQRAEEVRFAPARAAANPVASPRPSAVEDLVASGPGTLSPAQSAVSQGMGRRTPTGWEVVITRPLPAGLTRDNQSVVAFAVWEGSAQEAGSRKMRTAWIPLRLE